MSGKENNRGIDVIPEQSRDAAQDPRMKAVEGATDQALPPHVRDLLREARVPEAEFLTNIAHFEAARGSHDYQALLLDVQFVLRHWNDDFSKGLRADAYPQWSRPVFLALLEVLGEVSELSPEEEREQVMIADAERRAMIRTLIEERHDLERERQRLQKEIGILSNEGPSLFVDLDERSLNGLDELRKTIEHDYGQLSAWQRFRGKGDGMLKRKAEIDVLMKIHREAIAKNPLVQRQAEEEARQRRQGERIEGMRQRIEEISRRLEVITNAID